MGEDVEDSLTKEKPVDVQSTTSADKTEESHLMHISSSSPKSGVTLSGTLKLMKPFEVQRSPSHKNYSMNTKTIPIMGVVSQEFWLPSGVQFLTEYVTEVFELLYFCLFLCQNEYVFEPIYM